MSLLLTLEQGPRSQVVRQTRLDEGELVIGRSADAGWQIDDPDMFVSRAHCKISGGRDGYFVTDTSSSGLFIDDSDSPLGAGRSTRLQSGMRLRMGDYVLYVEVQPKAGQTSVGQAPAANQSTPQWSSPGARTPPSIGGDDFFSAKVEEEPRRPRPADLPDPFEQPVPGAYDRASNQRSSPAFDDPFSLDPVATPASTDDAAAGRSDPFGFGDMPSRGDAAEPTPKPSSFDDDFSFGPASTPASPNSGNPPGRGGQQAERPQAAAHPWDMPSQAVEPPPPPRSVAAPKPSRPAHAAPATEMALRAAFLRGMGVEEADFPGRDAIAEMEKFGREYRLMLDGLMQLLRKRAEEKGSARVAQTMVGASEVNPLKFLPTVEDVIVTIISERSPGFLSGEAAIGDAVKDLAQHHVRAWRGVQAALRRMIDRFDPAAIEEELKSNSALGNLLSGGRNAKLWELYQKRHRDIAQSAESSFLGEIGADFRDAYEEE
ncbi:type VI secretion system-associated FHA domain protein TagH [Mesorhizobium sp. M1C.F.Ca.ET.193.01.1.1]|uniref:type VI secretion system-associated FHA domain protein TagH n=1 Tax=unclassified Mesorhizobium TaxID=325217 RepID=UPI000FD512AD|nr:MULTISPECIES: type VI secretion system-associated FHA domain protein TagH [unclassified Mesorhizobium]TGS98194.1 type VI secretion system-associated FHA domain protein TagH [bacterium M00.F.Ca.ET.177.01.1.1]TGQ52703.1 type VI secretion system-associated FHA domain protein TagH [Mesorhizobium sp. M1C.F.Ca.ET.210.01.1.1]TGQ69974.1 type VI secretion system-associated FHA domain protein TagH [Mesorhizobium sp. M1C.F.Ca.ET.212.01.1.1]TGR05571.1 type VI secretion system-associated FHA domain prote